jgi:type VI secretion system protein VasD
MTCRRVLLAAPALLLLAQCGGPPPPKPPAPPVLTLTIVGGIDQNPDASGQPAPLELRLLYLAGTGAFEQADVFALLDHEKETLGQDEIGSETLFVTPGGHQTITRPLKPGVQAIGVIALFRDIDQAQWRADAPAAPNGPTRLILKTDKLTVTLTPAPAPPPASS